jgi:lipoprotein NlpD
MKKNDFFSGVGYVALAIFMLGLSACTSNVPAPVIGRDGQNVPTQAARIDTYTVKPGDTLYSIAREHGMELRELSALNGIEDPSQIAVGQVLRFRPAVPGAAVTAPVSSDVVVARPIGDAPATGKRPESGNTDRLKREPKAGKEPYSDQALAMARSNEQPTKPNPDANPVTPVTPVSSAPRPSGAAGGAEPTWIWPANGKIVGTFSANGSKGLDIAGKSGDPVIAVGDGRVAYIGTGLRGYGKLVIIKHNATYISAYAHNRNILVKEDQLVTKGQKIAEMGNTDADQVKLHFEIRRQGNPVDPLKYLPPR